MESILISTRVIVANTFKTSIPFGYFIDETEDNEWTYQKSLDAIDKYCDFLNESFKSQQSDDFSGNTVIFTPLAPNMQIYENECELSSMYLVYEHSNRLIELISLTDSEERAKQSVKSIQDCQYSFIPKLGDWKTMDNLKIKEAITLLLSRIRDFSN